MKKQLKSRHAVRRRCRDGQDGGLWIWHGISEKLCRKEGRHHARHGFSMRKTNRKENKQSQCAKRKRNKHRNSPECCCKAAAGDSCNEDLFSFVGAKQGVNDWTREYYNQRKRRHHAWKHSEDCSCERRFSPFTLNSESVLYREKSSALLFDQSMKGRSFTRIQKPEQVHADKSGGIEDIPAYSLVTDTSLSMQSIEKAKEGMPASGTERSDINKCTSETRQERDFLLLSLKRPEPCKPRVEGVLHEDLKLCLPSYSPYRHAKPTHAINTDTAAEESEGLAVLTPLGLLQRASNDHFNQSRAGYGHGQSEIKEIDLNIAVEEKSVMEISMLSTPPLSEFEGSLPIFQLPSSLKDFPKYKASINSFLLEEPKHSQKNMSAKECSLGSERCCKEEEVVFVSESEDEHMTIEKKNPEMALGNKDESTCLVVSPSHTQGAIDEVAAKKDSHTHSSFYMQDEHMQTGWKKPVFSTLSADDTPNSINIEPNLAPNGFKAREKRIIHKIPPEVLLATHGRRVHKEVGVAAGISCQEEIASTGLVCGENSASAEIVCDENISQKSFFKRIVALERQRWDPDILCDLCHQGPSLSLGEWYSWCCGSRLQNCLCGPTSLEYDALSVKRNEEQCSGKVHKMCALWSSKIYIDESGSIQGLRNAVNRGKSSKCTRCQQFGATLSCCVDTCSRSFHYPCADMLASQLRCCIRAGALFTLVCHEHRLAVQSGQNADVMLLDLKKRLKRVFLRLTSDTASQSLLSTQQSDVFEGRPFYIFQPVFAKSGEINTHCDHSKYIDMVMEISSDSEDMQNQTEGSHMDCDTVVLHSPNPISGSVEIISNNQGLSMSRHGGITRILYCIGDNLLCTDISGGFEAVPIPCTNDIDTAPAPKIKYITRSRYLARAKNILNSLLLENKNFALPCKECSCADIDNPHREVSFHVGLKDGQRHSDTRIDWQGQPMFGRLPYDQFGRLQVGPEMDIVECNSRCPCGLICLNRELQKGLRIHLEVFRTEKQGWAVRTMEPIPRGKFVVEYAGEILTHEEAHKRRGEYDKSKFSCLSSMDHLEDVSPVDLLVTDWYKMSNVAYFISCSCPGNLMIHRVYTHTMDLRFYRIGMYAARDIEIGEELSYENNHRFNCFHKAISFPLAPLRRSDGLMSVSE